jgi:putative hydrolase of the HAD superfamily
LLKALMVDVDGVIVRGRRSDGLHWSTDLEAALGLNPALLHRAFFAVEWEAIVLGQAALRDRLAAVLAAIAPTVSADRLIDYWFTTDARLDERLLADLAQARSGGLEVHLATNQEHERVHYLLNDLCLGAAIDGCHYSAALGCRKPEAPFFDAVTKRVGYAPAELLLIDDAEENVAAAKAAGWRALRWTPESVLHEALRQ